MTRQLVETLALRLGSVVLVTAAVLSLLATGGGGGGSEPQEPPVQACTVSVNSGFAGALDWVAGPTGVGSGADGQGGVGIQVSLGVSPVRGAQVTVRRSDGTAVGSALTDSLGRVTFKACELTGPFLVEAQGTETATYFDSALRPTGANARFGAGERMRAILPAITANIGVTPWTDAVVQRLLGTSTSSTPAGPLPSVSTIELAHDAVRDNAYRALMPDALHVDSLTLMPSTVDAAVPTPSLADRARDRYAIAFTALTYAAAQFDPTLSAPSVAAARAFALDAADGRIDNRGESGAAPANLADVAYAAGTLRQLLDGGLALAASRYATPALADRLPLTQALAAVAMPDGPGPGATTSARVVRLARDGVVALLNSDGTPDRTVAESVIAVQGASQSPSSALFFQRHDGSVATLGDGGPAGIAGMGAGFKSSTTVDVAALRNVSSISVGTAHAIARKPDGSVLGWGDAARGGLLGASSGVVLPQEQAGIAGAVSVLALNDLSFAVTLDGRVLAWGAGAAGIGNGSASPQVQAAPQPVLSASGGPVEQALALAGFANGPESTLAVLRADGKVWTWGENTHGGLGGGEAETGVARAAAAEVPGLSNIVMIASTDRGFVAVDAAGALYFWGSVPVTGDAGTPTVYSAPFAPRRIDGLPPVRNVQGAFAGLFQAKLILRDGDRWQTDGVGAAQTTASNELDVRAAGAGILTIGIVSGDGIVNAAERTAGVAVGGTITEADRPVTVFVDGVPVAAQVSGTSWAATLPASVLPTTGVITLSASFTGAAGLPSAPTSRTFVVDAEPPEVLVADSVSAELTKDPVTFTFTWSRPPAAFSSDAVVVTGGTRGLFAQVSPTVFTLQVAPPPDSAGELAVSVAANSVSDAVGNLNTRQVRATQAFKTRIPAVMISGVDLNDNYVRGPVTLLFEWNEPVTGFTAEDVHVSALAATKGPLVQLDSSNYSMVLTATDDGGFPEVSVVAGAVRDQLGQTSAAVSRPFRFMSASEVHYDFSGGPGDSSAGDGSAGDGGTPGSVPAFFFLDFIGGMDESDPSVTNVVLSWDRHARVDSTEPEFNVAYYLVLRRSSPDAELTKYARIPVTASMPENAKFSIVAPFSSSSVSYRVRACNGGSGVGSGGGVADENWCTDSNEVGLIAGLSPTIYPHEHWWPDIKPRPPVGEQQLVVQSISARGALNSAGEFTEAFLVDIVWNAPVSGLEWPGDIIVEGGSVLAFERGPSSSGNAFYLVIEPPAASAGTINVTIKDCAAFSIRATPNCSAQESASFRYRTP